VKGNWHLKHDNINLYVQWPNLIISANMSFVFIVRGTMQTA